MSNEDAKPCSAVALVGPSCNGKEGHAGLHFAPYKHPDGCLTMFEFEDGGTTRVRGQVSTHEIVSHEHPHTRAGIGR